MNDLIPHAVRVLEHQPTRSMEAEPLYRRAVREAGVYQSFPRFMAAVRERADCFAVIPADPALGDSEGWDPRHRSMYEAALETAGLMQPVIVLTDERTWPDTQDVEVSMAPADVFAEVQAALTHLLRSADPDDDLHAAATAAMHELRAVRRSLAP